MRAFLGYSTGFSTVTAVTNTGAVVAAVIAAENRYISVAAVYLATTYTLTVTSQLWEVTQVMRNYNRVLGDAHDMVEILGLEPAVPDRDGAPFPPGPGAVYFDHVFFTHDGAGDGCAVRGLHPAHRSRARRSAWSGTREAARPRSCGCCCASPTSTRAR